MRRRADAKSPNRYALSERAGESWHYSGVLNGISRWQKTWAMVELSRDLALLIVASAALPLQTIVTLLLARSSIRSAGAWAAGMIAVRLLQGVLFGVVVTAGEAQAGPQSPQYFFALILLVLSLSLYVTALRAAIGAEDEDAPPPRWVTKAGSMSPLTALAAGAGLMTLSVKFLVFTLGAIGAITEAPIGATLSVLAFVLFVLLAQGGPLTILALASSFPSRSAAILDGVAALLQRYNRTITIVLGLLFGTWFLLKALARLNVI